MIKMIHLNILSVPTATNPRFHGSTNIWIQEIHGFPWSRALPNMTAVFSIYKEKLITPSVLKYKTHKHLKIIPNYMGLILGEVIIILSLKINNLYAYLPLMFDNHNGLFVWAFWDVLDLSFWTLQKKTPKSQKLSMWASGLLVYESW